MKNNNSEENIKVFIRIRPLNPSEKKSHATNIITKNPQK